MFQELFPTGVHGIHFSSCIIILVYRTFLFVLDLIFHTFFCSSFFAFFLHSLYQSFPPSLTLFCAKNFPSSPTFKTFSFILTMVKLLITLQSSDPSFVYLCCRHCLEFSLYWVLLWQPCFRSSLHSFPWDGGFFAMNSKWGSVKCSSQDYAMKWGWIKVAPYFLITAVCMLMMIYAVGNHVDFK